MSDTLLDKNRWSSLIEQLRKIAKELAIKPLFKKEE